MQSTFVSHCNGHMRQVQGNVSLVSQTASYVCQVSEFSTWVFGVRQCPKSTCTSGVSRNLFKQKRKLTLCGLHIYFQHIIYLHITAGNVYAFYARGSMYQKTCQKHVVKCDFVDIGCTVQMTRDTIVFHQADMALHFRIMSVYNIFAYYVRPMPSCSAFLSIFISELHNADSTRTCQHKIATWSVRGNYNISLIIRRMNTIKCH